MEIEGEGKASFGFGSLREPRRIRGRVRAEKENRADGGGGSIVKEPAAGRRRLFDKC